MTNAELESKVRQLEQRNAATAEELRCSRDREKALREQLHDAEARVAALESKLREASFYIVDRNMIARIDEALAAAVPPKSPDVELYEAQERFVDARRAAAVPQPPRANLTPDFIDQAMQAAPAVIREVQEQAGERMKRHPRDPLEGVDTNLRIGGPHVRPYEGPALPQPPRDVVDEAVETRAREAMIEPTSTNKLSGRWEAPAVPQGEPPRGHIDTSCGGCMTGSGDHDVECMRWEPTPAPQSEPSSHFTCDHYGPCDCVSDGAHLCPSEAPPAGEPTPDPTKVREALERAFDLYSDATVSNDPTRRKERRIHAQIAREAALVLVGQLAAQPAPASPPRDERLVERILRQYRIDVLAMRDSDDHRHRESVARCALFDIDRQLAAPTVSREVDEAAADRYRLAIDLPEDVYPPERWVREVNKTCADLGLAECRIVAVDVDEAAVRAALQDAVHVKALVDKMRMDGDDGMVGLDTVSFMMRGLVALLQSSAERPAASGKDVAT